MLQSSWYVSTGLWTEDQEIHHQQFCYGWAEFRVNSWWKYFPVTISWLPLKWKFSKLPWLERNKFRHQDLTRKVLGLIRYGLMSGGEMEYVLAQPVFKSDECSDVLKVALQYHMKLFSQAILSTSLERMRDGKDCLVVMGVATASIP